MENPHSPSRREILRLAAGATAAALMPSALAAAPAQLMRKIPKSGEALPAVGLGSSRTFDVGTAAVERSALREVLKLFVEQGGRVVDSSPMYGEAESVIGDLAAELGIAGQVFLATKVWTSGRDAGIRQMEESFKLLRTKRIDLMQVHNLSDWKTQLKTLREWKDQGRLRYIGITHYTESAYDDLAKVMQSEDIDFVQFNYSIAERAAEDRLLPLAHERRIAVLVNRPFARSGLFEKVRGKTLPPWADEIDCTSWAQFFLKFILGHPAVTCAIPATSKPKHLLDNMQAGLGRQPDAATRERMARLVAEL
ncbi:MAG: aldo/keto reductase [Burkholderiales bacterium]|nr:aldo/keto reductase [Burkholderiales bacterium]